MMRFTAAMNAARLRGRLPRPSWSAILAWSPWLTLWLAHKIRSIPALAAKVARCAVVPNARSAAAFTGVGDRDAGEAEPLAQLPADDGRRQLAGPLGSGAGYTAQDTITSLTPLAIAAR
jgi:hypothetical protein